MGTPFSAGERYERQRAEVLGKALKGPPADKMMRAGSTLQKSKRPKRPKR